MFNRSVRFPPHAHAVFLHTGSLTTSREFCLKQFWLNCRDNGGRYFVPAGQRGNHLPEISVTCFESAIFSASTRLGPCRPRSKLMVPLILVVGPFWDTAQNPMF